MLNEDLWQLTRFYFDEWNKERTDCHFEIDDINRTIKATDYTELPHLFYYPTSNGNKAYKSLKEFKK